jgi:type II secretory pathway pseudopilin PulG
MNSASPKSRRNEAGYTLLLVVFMVATMLIAAAIARPNIITEGRRQKEEEMIWRGNQYARAIGLYYRAFGRFPTKVEDLTNQTNGVRFLRHAYPDPMNKENGSWRFIYIGPNGILIGSNRQQSLLQGALNGAGMPGMGMPPLTGTMGQLANSAQNNIPGSGAPGLPVVLSPNNNSSADSSSSSSGFGSQPQPLGGSTIGGNIIGVGSKIDKGSLRLYIGEDNYKNWEFIWNPLRTAVPGQPPANSNGPAAPGGANTNGQPPPAPVVGSPTQ